MDDRTSFGTPGETAPARRRRRRRVDAGGRFVHAVGIEPSFWNDAYHLAMTVSWPLFVAAFAALFVLLNGCFALLYGLVPESVANSGNSFINLLYFSIETITTVGYGEMFPQGHWGHIVVAIETFSGMFYSAAMLGLIFARVSRPRARLIFSRSLVVSPVDGVPTLSMRVANARLNVIGSATARMWVLLAQYSMEKVLFRRFVELKLVRNENPTFVLSWTVMHRIDETSPLFGLTAEDLRLLDAFFTISIEGYDETSAQMVRSRQSYADDQILWNHRFVDMIGRTEEDETLLDYANFHRTEALSHIARAERPLEDDLTPDPDLEPER